MNRPRNGDERHPPPAPPRRGSRKLLPSTGGSARISVFLRATSFPCPLRRRGQGRVIMAVRWRLTLPRPVPTRRVSGRDIPSRGGDSPPDHANPGRTSGGGELVRIPLRRRGQGRVPLVCTVGLGSWNAPVHRVQFARASRPRMWYASRPNAPAGDRRWIDASARRRGQKNETRPCSSRKPPNVITRSIPGR